jgi:hypothetical protein
VKLESASNSCCSSASGHRDADVVLGLGADVGAQELLGGFFGDAARERTLFRAPVGGTEVDEVPVADGAVAGDVVVEPGPEALALLDEGDTALAGAECCHIPAPLAIDCFVAAAAAAAAARAIVSWSSRSLRISRMVEICACDCARLWMATCVWLMEVCIAFRIGSTTVRVVSIEARVASSEKNLRQYSVDSLPAERVRRSGPAYSSPSSLLHLAQLLLAQDEGEDDGEDRDRERATDRELRRDVGGHDHEHR